MKKIICFGFAIVSLLLCSSCGNPCKNGHSWENATCTTPKTCTVCNMTEGNELGHDFKNYMVETEATCSVEGRKIAKCERCDETHSQTIEKKPHSEGEWKVITQPTATSAGEKVLLCSVCNSEIKKETFTLTPEEIRNEFVKKCATYSYKEIARNPDNYKGKNAVFKGEVIQVMEEDNICAYRIDITKERYGWTDTIYVLYTRKDSTEPRILEDDIVTIYGTLTGNYTYTTVMGAEMTIPSMLAEYIELN